ncbi:Subtilisin-like protease [Acorus gramineus]|uniref:Subtilisin-like protease n=1 Tax=Acorus gramineus TaxID=55184 RepID=A0AAV9AE83_ACOGR|nr:Subtilisin-like protease [Acorus gramineus]
MGSPLLLLLLLGSSLLSSALSPTNVYIIYMGETRQGKGEDPKVDQDLQLHHSILSSVLGSDKAAADSILYSYEHGFSGFAAVLTSAHAELISGLPGVARVVPNRILSLHTTRSWDFLQLDPDPVNGLLSMSRSGDGSIIGVLDTGIWPESRSFRDDYMGEVPSRWRGVCQEGEEFNRSNCNRKIIGARWYIKGYEAEFGKLNTSNTIEFLSARDAVGHGTHTSSTAAGVLVKDASFMGLAQGIARGGASSARVAVYKVCWATGGCSSADILAAFDDAIHDGVDVLSVSLGSSPPLSAYVDDVLSIGSFHAVARGITVVCSAGNSGPYSQTVINTAPWIISVAASTIDRAFPTPFTLGDNQTEKYYPIVYAEDIANSNADDFDARGCDAGSLNGSLAKGNVIVCFQTRQQRSAIVALKTVRKNQGAGLIFAHSPTKDITPSTSIPCIQVDFETGTRVLAYMQKTRSPVVKFSLTKTAVGTLISPEVAFFSSRGPSSLSPSVLKPDVAAPGVNILASWSPASLSTPDTGPLDFKIESGTSMSCPHISAIVALLKSIHPSWSPAAIKSALITTGGIHFFVAEGAPHKQADPFDYGGGHVNPNKAVDPGTDLNLPSITVPDLKEELTVSRTVTNIGAATSIYTAIVEAPPGISVRIHPPVLAFNSTARELEFRVTFHARLRVQGRYSFGSLTWEDGLHKVRIPLAVRIVIDEFYAET